MASSSTLSFVWVLGSVQSWYCLGGTASFCVRWKSHCSEKLFTWLLTTILDFPYDPVNSSSKIAGVVCSVAPFLVISCRGRCYPVGSGPPYAPRS
uniref:Putative secreted protein n=1 Tax=Ixodes ricinus TaxID=34613 RepID=A0A6B0UCV2_IXORI